jgi:hypothetical protein
MTYLQRAAQAIKAEVPPDKLPKADTTLLFLIYATLMFAKGEAVTAEDVHNAWAAWATHVGKVSKALVPFDQLSADMQAQDQPFVDAIVAAAQHYRTTS